MAARFLAIGAALAAAVAAAPQATGTPAPQPTDPCVSFCDAARAVCNENAQDPNNPNHPLCASWYSQCVGYSPYNGNYVEPTACVSTQAVPTATGAPDACAGACLSSYMACSTASGPAAGYCAYQLSKCLGQSPFYNGVYYAPVSCANEPTSTAAAAASSSPAVTTTVVTAYTTYCPGPTTIVHNNQTITVTGATTLTVTNCPCTLTGQPQPVPTAPAPAPNSCVATCNAALSACQNAAGANMALCASKYSGCLGYNPWGSGSFVTPTACSSQVVKPTPTNVVVGAGGRVAVPGALAALGALALL